jgi:hypothetical protein
MDNELDRECEGMAATTGGGETTAPVEGYPAGRRPKHGIRKGAGGCASTPRDTRPDRATRFV